MKINLPNAKSFPKRLQKSEVGLEIRGVLFVCLFVCFLRSGKVKNVLWTGQFCYFIHSLCI